MTIISPSRRLSVYRFLMFIFAILIIGGIFYIYQYNQLVDLRHNVSSLEKAIIKAEVINTDLKNELYRALDPIILKKTAKENGLILDSRPDYLSLKEQWLSDSSY